MNAQANRKVSTGKGQVLGIDREKLALAVRMKRETRTLRDVAPEVGMSYVGITRIEQATGCPTADNYVRLCAWLGVPVDYFVKRAS